MSSDARKARPALLKRSRDTFETFGEQASAIPSLEKRGASNLRFYTKQTSTGEMTIRLQVEPTEDNPAALRLIHLETPAINFRFNRYGAVALRVPLEEGAREMYTPDATAKFVDKEVIHPAILEEPGTKLTPEQVGRDGDKLLVITPWAYFPLAGQEAITAHFNEAIQHLTNPPS